MTNPDRFFLTDCHVLSVRSDDWEIHDVSAERPALLGSGNGGLRGALLWWNDYNDVRFDELEDAFR